MNVVMEELRKFKGDVYSVYSSEGSLVDIILGVIYGVDYFEVDYPN